MTEIHERTTLSEEAFEPAQADSAPVDVDESGALAIGLMVAVVAMVALLTLALIISIP